jgi:hypothetical protein
VHGRPTLQEMFILDIKCTVSAGIRTRLYLYMVQKADTVQEHIKNQLYKKWVNVLPEVG